MRIKSLDFLVLLGIIFVCSWTNTAAAAIKPPSNLVATAVSSSQINLSWKDNTNNETGFRIQRAENIVGPWTQIPVGPNVTSYQDTGLKPSTKYLYVVQAVTKTDKSINVGAEATTFAAPTTTVRNTTTSVRPTTTTTSVRPNTTTSVRPTTTTTSVRPTTTTTSVRSTTTTTSVRPTTTTVLVTSSTTTSISTVPVAPSNLTASAASCSQINLSWRDNSTNETGFKVERANSSTGPWTQIITVGANVTSYSNTGLNASTTYYYRVCAYNTAGNSSYSNTALTATPACPTTTTIPPSTPQLVGFLPGVGTPKAVAVAGNRAYLASNDFGISVLDVTSQSNPQVMSASNSPFAGRNIAVSGTVAVVTGKTPAGQAHLWVLNVANASQPEVAGECDIAVVEIMDVAINSTATMAVVAGNTSGIRVVNLSNPAAPAVMGTYDTPGVAYGVAFNSTGTLVYLADGVEGIKVISLSNPQSPSLVGSLKITSRVYRDIAVMGSTAFLANQNGTLDVINVSNPAAPAFVGSEPLTGGGFYLQAAGSYAAVIGKASTADLLHIVNISAPNNPFLEGSSTVGAAGSVTGVELAGGYAYVAAGGEGLKIYKVGSAPVYQTTLSDDFVSKRIAVAETTAVVGGLYLPASTNRLKVLDVADVSQPEVAGECDIAVVEIMDVAINSTATMAVVAGNTSGIRVVNLSNPAAPAVMGTYDTPGVAYGVAFNSTGSLVYLADGVEGIKVISLSNPQSPSLVGSLKITSRVYRDIAVTGSTAFLANQNGTLDVINVSNPAAPAFVGSEPLTGGGFYLQAAGSYAAVIGKASTADLLHIVNISTPNNPFLEGSSTVGAAGSVNGVELADGYAYAAAGSNGLKIYNVANPGNPVLDSTVTVPGTASDVVVDNMYAYVAGFPATVSIIDLYTQ